MQSLHHSRGRILFEVVCAFGIAASCVWAWQQTWSTAMLAMAAIATLYGLVHAFDMVRRGPKADMPVEVVGPALVDRKVAPAIQEKPEFAKLPAEALAEQVAKRNRKSPRQKGGRDKQEAKLEIAVAVAEAEPEAVKAEPAPEPEVGEPEPELHVAQSASDEPEYVPATPLFEPEPFVRQQRAAFGRKARY